MAADTMTLPPGFVLEDDAPQLPEGFVLESDGSQPATTSPEMLVAASEPPVKQLSALQSVPALLNLGVEKAGRGLVGAMNLGAKAESYLLGRGGVVKKPFEYGKSPLPEQVNPRVAQVLGGGQPFAPDPVTQGLGESAYGAVRSWTTPENLAMLPMMALKPILAVLVAQQAANLPEQTIEGYKTVTDPNKPLKEKAKAVGDVGISGAMTLGGGKALLHEAAPTAPKPPTILDQTLSDVLAEGPPARAGSVVPAQEAAGVNPAVQARPETPPPPVITPPKGFVLEEEPTPKPTAPTETSASLPKETAPEQTVEDQIARDRAEAEADVELNHEKRGLASLLMNKTQLKGMPKDVQADFMSRGDAATTVAEVKALREEVDKAFPATKESAPVPIVTSLGEPPVADLAETVAKGQKLTPEQLKALPEVGTPEHGAYLARVRELRKAALNPPAVEALKPQQLPVSPPSFKNVPESERSTFQKLGIQEGANAHDALTRMAEDPRYFRPERAALANFLVDNYEHVLRTVGLEPGVGRAQRPNYEPIDHSINLGVDHLQGWPIEDVLLHEAAHAATYWQVTHPRTALQRAAVARLETIMEQSKARLTSAERNAIGKVEEAMPYAHSSLAEFVGGLFSDSGLREHLNNIKMGDKSLFEQAWDVVKQILGIEPKTALDEAFNVLKEIGQSREGINEARALYELKPIEMPQPTRTAAVIDEASRGEKLSAFVNKAKGYSVPKHAAANEEVANKLVRYASARIAAPEVARSMATEVLGTHWKDGRFDNVLGRVLVEDRLRAIKKTFNDLAANEPDPLKKQELLDKANSVRTLIGNEISSEQAFQNAIKNPDIAAAIQRHIDTVQPLAEKMHRELGGEVAAPGENTDAFVNLKAIFGDTPDEARSMIFGSRRGELTNPLKRGSMFSKRAKGTAERYELSYRNIAERMVRGNYEQYALREYYTALEDAGLGYIEKPKDLALEAKQTTSGKALATIPVEIKGTAPGTTTLKKLYVRPDLAHELRQALQVDGRLPRTAIGHLMDVVTRTQMLGLTDFTYHSVNMLATIAGSQGSRSAWYDVVRKATPVGVIDGVSRMGYEFIKSVMDTPEVQKSIADLSEIGAGRAKPEHQGIVAKGAQLLGMDPNAARWLSSSHWMKTLDRAGRVAMSKMFDNMVQRGLVKDTELNRREWINQMGQYNERLMGKYQALLRESSLSSFVVAGRSMNRNAFRRITTSNVIKAANPEAWAKIKIVDAVSLVAMLYAIPATMNIITTGKPTGRPGTHPGAVDLGGPVGPDGKHKEFDLLQLLLLRRGLRNMGFEALRKGQQENLPMKDTVQNMSKDIFDGIVHPWAGPTVRTAKIAITGKDTRGYLESRNPNDFAENLIAAAKNVNPMVAAMLREPEKSKTGSLASSLAPALGVKDSRTPTLEEQGKLSGTIGERRQAMKEPKPERNELATRAAGERAYWGAYAKQDALRDALPKEQTKWLDKNGLKLRGFETELTVGRVRIPGSQEENDFMKEAVRSEYEKQITRLMDSSVFQSLSAAKKQERLDRLLTQARLRARASLRRKMVSQASSTYNLRSR